jgi:hypothetical protein
MSHCRSGGNLGAAGFRSKWPFGLLISRWPVDCWVHPLVCRYALIKIASAVVCSVAAESLFGSTGSEALDQCEVIRPPRKLAACCVYLFRSCQSQ